MLWWVVQNLVVTALLAGVVWVICRITQIGPAARHALWLVVLIKIVTPPFVVWPWGVSDMLAAFETQSSVDNETTTPVVAIKPTQIEYADSFIPEAGMGDAYEVPLPSVPMDSIAISVDQVPIIETSHEPPSDAETTLPAPLITANPQELQSTITIERGTPDRNWSPLLLQVGGITWIVGAVLFASIQAIRIVRMSLRLRGAGPPNELVARQIATIAKRLQMKKIEARVVAGIGSPFVWAFARPRLLWPTELPENLSQPALQGLIVHELAHIKRRDHWVGWLELVAGCIWWWNPLFWYVRHQLRENAELACDAWVVGTLPTGRRAYAEALLAVCESVSKLTAPIPAVGATASGRHAIERRLNMILRGQNSFRLSRGGSLAALVLAATALPAWSQRSQLPRAYVPGERIAGISDSTLEGAEILALLEEYQQQEAAARQAALQQAQERRQALIDKLQAMQDKYARQGKLDEAIAVRDQIRKLGPRTTRTAEPAPRSKMSDMMDLDSLSNYRDQIGLADYRERVGHVLAFEVVGSTEGTVWGSGIYSDDSHIGTAAVHAGLLEPGQRGRVRVILAGPGESFAGSTRNGVTTSSYGPWQGSFVFAPATLSRDNVRPDPTTLYDYRDHVAQVFTFDITGSTDGTVWGSDIYTDDSPLATAAVHAGMLQPGQKGVVRVLILPGQSNYIGSTKNDVTTHDYQSFGGSYRILSVQIDPHRHSPIPGMPGEMPAGGAPPATGGFGSLSLGGSTLTQYRDHVGKTLSIPVGPDDFEGPVWGSGVYTDDSSIGAAAVHAGILKPGETRNVLVRILPGRKSYEGSTQNGITTIDYGPWEGSFQFVPNDTSSKLNDFFRKQADYKPDWSPAVGEEVSVEWGNRWWKATVLAVPTADEIKIHYEGYGDNYDEVVPRERVRQPEDEPELLEPTSGFHFNRTLDLRC